MVRAVWRGLLSFFQLWVFPTTFIQRNGISVPRFFFVCCILRYELALNDTILQENMKSAIKLIINPKVNFLKTLYFNFHYFPFKTAIRMPFIIYWRSILFKTKGQIVIDAPIETGMVRFGAYGLGTQDFLYSRTMWEVFGTLVIKGKTNIGRGSKISVEHGATLVLGRNFTITGNSEIICQKEITFGCDCLLSWDILIMDSDLHQITNESGEKINTPKPIAIGNHVWIGCRNTILKGVIVADNTIISANSTITRNITEPNCAIGGHGKSIEILKKGINWNM